MATCPAHFYIMNILAGIFFVILIVTAWVCGSRQKRIDQLEREFAALESNHLDRDNALDWLLRQYELHTDNPYVNRPAIVSIKRGLPVVDKSELRCYHCNTPVEHGHTNICPWVIVRPLCQSLYQNPSK